MKRRRRPLFMTPHWMRMKAGLAPENADFLAGEAADRRTRNPYDTVDIGAACLGC
jgi:hypothetical protein